MDNGLDPTDYERTDNQLERFLMFCMMVAGKRSDVTREKHKELLDILGQAGSPLAAIRTLDGGKKRLAQILRHVKTGKYNLLVEGFWMLAERHDMSLKTCSESDLRHITGVGPKTAEFFLVHSRPGRKGAVLDTHVLRWLREEHGYKDAPRYTPQDQDVYDRYAGIFMRIAEGKGITPAELDYEVWKRYGS